MDEVNVLFIAVLLIGGWAMFAAGYDLGKRRGREIEKDKAALAAERNRRKFTGGYE